MNQSHVLLLSARPLVDGRVGGEGGTAATTGSLSLSNRTVFLRWRTTPGRVAPTQTVVVDLLCNRVCFGHHPNFFQRFFLVGNSVENTLFQWGKRWH